MNELQEKIARLPAWAREYIKRLELAREPLLEEAKVAKERANRYSEANAALMELLSVAGRSGIDWAAKTVQVLEGYDIFKRG